MKARLLFILLATMSVALGQSTKNLNQFTELPESPNAADWIYLWDSSSNISKKVSPANLFKAMPVAGLSQVGGVKRNVGGSGEFVSGIDASGNLLYGAPAGSGGSISITGTRVPFGNGSGSLTSDAGFEYNATTNQLSVPNVSVTEVRFGTDNITLGSPTPGVFYISEGTLTGDELAFDLSSDNAIRLFSGTGVSSVQFDGIDVIVPAEAYNEGTWNGSNEVPTKDAVRDKFEALTSPITANLIPYGSGAGTITTEAAFSYDPIFNILRTGSILLGGDTAGWISYGASTLSLEAASLEKFTFDLATPNTVKFTTDSGITQAEYVGMSVKAPSFEGPTITKFGTQAAPITTNPYAPTWTTQDAITYYGATGEIDLPAISTVYPGGTFFVYITGTFNVTVDPNGSEIIVENGASLGAGVADSVSGSAGTFVGYTCDGSRWIKLEGGGAGDAVLAGGNAFTGNQTIDGTLGVTGVITAQGITITDPISGDVLPAVIPARTYDTITTPDAMIFTPTAGVSNVVVTTDSLTTITLDATTETLTYSGTPTTGTVFHYLLTAHTSDCTVTIPSTYSFATGGNRTTYVVRANKNVYISVFRSASAYYMWGDPVEIGTLPEDTTPAITAKVEIDQGNGGEFASLTNIRNLINGDSSGTFGTPTTTNPYDFDFNGGFHAIYYGATGEIDLPDAANYADRGVTIYNTGAFTITIDTVDVTDVIVRDGTEQSAGVSFTLSSGAGNFVNLISDGEKWITLGYKGTLNVGS